MVNLRSVAQENVKDVKIQPIPKGTGVPSKDALQSTTSLVGHVLFSSNSCWILDAQHYCGRKYENVPIFDRARLRPGDKFAGPCIVTEVSSWFECRLEAPFLFLFLFQIDSTTFIIPDHHAEIDDVANTLIWPESQNVTRTVPKTISDPIVVQLVEGMLNPFFTQQTMDLLTLTQLGFKTSEMRWMRWYYEWQCLQLCGSRYAIGSSGLSSSVSQEIARLLPNDCCRKRTALRETGLWTIWELHTRYEVLSSLAILHSDKTGFLSSWDESIEEGEWGCHPSLSHYQLSLFPFLWSSKVTCS